MQILRRKWTHMCLENKLSPVCCLLGSISNFTVLFKIIWEGYWVIWKRYYKKKKKRQCQRRNDWPASLKATSILTSYPGPVVCITKQVDWPCCPSRWLSHTFNGFLAAPPPLQCFPSCREMWWMRRAFLVKNCNQPGCPAFPAPPGSVCPSLSHTLLLGLSMLAPSAASQRYYSLTKSLFKASLPFLNGGRKHQRCEGCFLPGSFQAEAPGDDRWARSMWHLFPSLIFLPSLLPSFPCKNAQWHFHEPARGLAHAGLESVALITRALMSISPLLWSCPWHAEERKIWLLSEAHLTLLPRNGTLSVSGFHGWVNEITTIFSSLEIKGLPSSCFRPIRIFMHLILGLNGHRTQCCYFYKTSTTSR